MLRTTRRELALTVPVACALSAGWHQANGFRVGVAAPVAVLGTALAMTVLLIVVTRHRTPQRIALGTAIAVPMAASRVVGAHFHPINREMPFDPLTVTALAAFALDWAFWTVATTALLGWLSTPRRPVTRTPMRGWPARTGWALVPPLVMLLAWTPYLLVYWPGIMVRDSWSSVFIGTGVWPLGNHHPVLFSWYVGRCMALASSWGGGTTAGVAVFAITQALLLAVGLTVVVAWLRARLGTGAAAAALAFFAVSPQVAMWSITMHKDTLFCLWLTLTTVLLVEVSLRGLVWLCRPAPLAALAALLACLSFSRNNGLYVALGLATVLLLVSLRRLLRRRHLARWSRLPVALVATVAAILVVQGPGYDRWGVAPSEHVEAVGLQLHQIDWAITYGTSTEEQRQRVGQFMPVERLREVMSPTIVDSVKFDKAFDTKWVNQHPDEFAQLWRDIAPANRVGYAQAWYALAGGYTDPGRFFTRFDVGTKRGSGKLVVNDRDLLGPHLGIDDLPRRTSVFWSTLTRQPGPHLFFAMPLLFWVSLTAAVDALLRRRPSRALAHLPWLGTVGTLCLAAPVTDFRYVAGGHFALPVLLAALWFARPTSSSMSSRQVSTSGAST